MKRIKHRPSSAISPVVAETLESRRLFVGSPPYTYFAVNDATVNEGATLEIPVHTDGIGPGQTLNVAYSIVHGSATADDYVSPSGSLTLVGGYGTANGTISLATELENLVEGNELLTVRIDSVSMGTAGRPYPDGASTLLPVTIVDATPVVSISTTNHGSEDLDLNTGQTVPVQFTVARSGGDISAAMTVAYDLTGAGASPATPGTDTGGAASGTITIPANATSALLEIAVTDDDQIEAALESLKATLAGGGLGAMYAYPGFSAIVNPNPPAPMATGEIQDNDFKIVAAKAWFDHQGLKGDDGFAYGDSWVDWNGDGDASDTNEQVKSISYFRSDATTNRFVKPTVYFEVEGNFTSPNYTIKGTGGGPGGGDFEKQVTLEASGSTRFFRAEDTLDAKLPTTIDKGALAIQWQIVREKRADKPISYGSTSNTIYVTGAAAPREFETVVKLGCEGNSGKTPGTDDTNILDTIWDKFSERHTKRLNGTDMEYWGEFATNITAEDSRFGEVFTVAGLLKNGDGRCGAWAQLLIDVLQTSGLTAQKRKILPNHGSEYPVGSDVLLEKAIVINPAAPAQGGVPGQNKFTDHSVVTYQASDGLRIYDPSYGGDYVASLQDWEAADAFWGCGTVYSLNGVDEINPTEDPFGLDTTW